jgi:hypothetical protein
MYYINNIHITQFEKWDNIKEYKQIKKNLKTKEDAIKLLHHIKMTTPVFGEWNIITDRKLPEQYLNYLKK